MSIVVRALQQPLRQIAENAGFEGSVVVNEVRRGEKGRGLDRSPALVRLVFDETWHLQTWGTTGAAQEAYDRSCRS
jgi:chaperonin GroEL (HSP60 family)